MTNETLDSSNTGDTEPVQGPGPADDEALKKAPEPEPIPLHDCELCPDKFVACKHSVPVHLKPTPLVRGKAGLEDFYNKVNELVEIVREMDLTKKKS